MSAPEVRACRASTRSSRNSRFKASFVAAQKRTRESRRTPDAHL